MRTLDNLARSKPLTLMVPPLSRLGEKMFGLRVEAYVGELVLAMSKMAAPI